MPFIATMEIKMNTKESIELASGYFELVEYNERKLTIRGWMLSLEKKIDSISVFINKEHIKTFEVIVRDDVAQVFPFISYAKYSGFSVSIEMDPKNMDELIDIILIGAADGEKIAKIQTYYSKEWSKEIPIPPPHLMKRAANTEYSSFFRASAFKTYRDYWQEAIKYIDFNNVYRILDWGCGCGRLTYLLSKISKTFKVYGCDIDKEAISWCRDNIQDAQFTVIPLTPPTNYPPIFFNLIIGNSILTHLTKDLQIQWLTEAKRILTPNGLFIASVHGESATYFSFPTSNIKNILKNGIYDKVMDTALNGIAPPNYYRGTFQSKEYTIKTYSQYFEVLDYVERGSMNHQDLVVMKKM